MVVELNSIIKLIDEHFNRYVWYSPPPLNEVDFQLILLAQKIIELRDTLSNVKDVDCSISEILTYMEKTFLIPMCDINNWIQKSKIKRQLIMDIYNKLSNLRSI